MAFSNYLFRFFYLSGACPHLKPLGSDCFNLSTPRRMRDFTVPRDIPSSWAISGCVNPLKYESFNTISCFGGSLSMAFPKSWFSSVWEAEVAMSILSSTGCTSRLTSMLVVSFRLLRDLYRSTLRLRTNTISQLVNFPFCGLNAWGFFQRAVKASWTTSSASHLLFNIW